MREAVDRAVAELHRAGWIHGDLYFENVGYRRVRGGWVALFLGYDTAHRMVGSEPPEWFARWRRVAFNGDAAPYAAILEEERTALHTGWLACEPN